MSLYQVDQKVNALQAQVDALKAIIQLTTRVNADGTELIAVSLPNGEEYKMAPETFFKSRGKAEPADYSLVAADKNSIIDMTGNSATFTIPNDLSWQNFSSCYLIQSGTGLTIASGGSVTVNSPQTLVDQQDSIYVIFKTATNEFTIVQIGSATSGGDTTNNYYSSILAPQIFNPDGAGVTAGAYDCNLSSVNTVAFVTINGQTLDDSEYSLTGNTLTVMPDNGFTDTSDEVLVFQHSFSTTSGGGVVNNYAIKPANYTILKTDSDIEVVTPGATITLPSAVGIGGQEFTIDNNSGGNITLNTTLSQTITGGGISGTSITVADQEIYTVKSNNTNYRLR